MWPMVTLLRRVLPTLSRHGRALARNQRGTTATEFGLLAIPFFAIIGAILETSMTFFAGQVLDSAVQDATRKVLTGQAQGSAWTASDFRNEICDGLYGLFDCSKLKIKVSTITSFSDTSAAVVNPIDPTCTDPDDPSGCWQIVESYNPGAGSSIVLVQAYYKWPVIVNFGGFNLANQPDGSRLLATVRVFRNEPFS
jgi:Flp pilus assembly protein TadG